MTRPEAGLCDSCRHQRMVRTGRGSVFSLCQRSRSEPEYPRYPRLPVLDCGGHEPGRGASMGDKPPGSPPGGGDPVSGS